MEVGREKKEINKCELPFEKETVKNLLFMKKRADASEMVVQEILKTEKIYTLRHDEHSEIWIYRKGIYVPDGKTYIKEFVRKVIDALFTPQFCNEVIGKIESETYISDEDFFINENFNYIVVENGIVDLFENKILPFDDTKFFFQKIPVEYKKDADCPNIKKFFKETLLEEDIAVLQEIFGYLLYRDMKFEKAFMFNGEGRNGKGKTVELMKRFIGVKNCANVSLQRLEKDNFALSGLHNKLANLSADISYTALKETGNFKSLTGHDLLSAPRKFRTDLDFLNYAKMIFCANELPATSDITHAFFNRWLLIEFPFTFYLEKEFEKVKNKPKCKLADKSIIEKISTDEELSGLLNWAIEGLQRLFSKNDFSYSKSTDEVKKQWIKKSDSFTAFCLEILEEDWEGKVLKDDIVKYYALYCKENKVRTYGDKHIKKVLERMFGSTDFLDNYTGKRFWTGFVIKQDIRNFVEEQVKNNTKKVLLTSNYTGKTGFSMKYRKKKFIEKNENPVFPVLNDENSSLFINRQEIFDFIMKSNKNLGCSKKEILAKFGKKSEDVITDLLKHHEIYEWKPFTYKIYGL